MNSAFDSKSGTWKIKWSGRIARHDIVYLTPPWDPIQGMPIGNGDIGVLCWCKDSKIILAVNKCDLWDDAKFGHFHNWKAEEEEYSTTLRHAGRIIIDFEMPIFNLFYLSDFKGRVSLADASLTIFVSGAFGEASIKAFVSHQDGILCCEVQSKLKESLPVEITIERFGSRTFSHWYSLVDRDAELGLKGTQSSFDEEGAYITHRLRSGRFALGCRIVDKGKLKTSYLQKHSHASRIILSGRKDKRFILMIAVTSPISGSPIKAVKEKLATAEKKSFSVFFSAHKKAWKEFWLRSLMEYGDDYLDNLWHLTMYYANASQRGKYPGRFINGLWTWNRDVQPWNFYFHWNQQQTYWPLNAAGHHDLVDSYLEYRFNSLSQAKKDAKEWFGVQGAFVSDVAERRGYNDEGAKNNHTPVAQIAMDFWRQYRFTGNMDFLKKHALPYILEAAYFFESLFEKDKDGKYHAKEGSGYEGWIKLRDCISELVCAKVLFSTAIKALEEAGVKDEHAKKWKEIIDNLASLPVIEADKSCLEEENGRFKFKRGFFKGETAFSDKILAVGFGIKEKRWLTSKVPSDEKGTSFRDIYETIQRLEFNETPYSAIKEDMKVCHGIFPGVENSAVFPSGVLGFPQKGSELFKAAVNTAKLYAPDSMGIFRLPIVLARLGLARETKKIIENWPSRWQVYCNGFGRYGPRDIMKADASLKLRINLVKDASLPEGKREEHKFPFPAWPFRHMGMESMSVLVCAMNESLLQSYDGIIRVAPAIIKEQNARFTLHAVDGFVVSAEIKKGEPAWIFVSSRLGKICRIENPWSKAYLYKNGGRFGCLKQKIIEFPTQQGDLLMIVPAEKDMKEWKTVPVEYPRNKECKTSSCGKAKLGLPRMF